VGHCSDCPITRAPFASRGVGDDTSQAIVQTLCVTAYQELPGPGRLRKAFRIGLARESGFTYKPIATVGITKDGGIFVAPAQVRDFGWKYGIMRPSGPVEGDTVTTRDRPKLHYHRSGIASVTLTGADLERRSLLLTPLPTISAAQVLSVVAIRPWELESAKHPRKGDVFTRVRKWPTSVAFSLSVVVASEDQQRSLIVPELAPTGLLPLGDETRFVVSLSAYGREAMLVGAVRVLFDEDQAEYPGTTVTALPWTVAGRDSNAESLGLWSTSLRNPMTLHEDTVPTSLSPAQGTVYRKYDRHQ
jgi:hypothetical protein